MKVRPERYCVIRIPSDEDLAMSFKDESQAAAACHALCRIGQSPRLIAFRTIVSGRDWGFFSYPVRIGWTPEETIQNIRKTLGGTLKQHQERNPQ